VTPAGIDLTLTDFGFSSTKKEKEKAGANHPLNTPETTANQDAVPYDKCSIPHPDPTSTSLPVYDPLINGRQVLALADANSPVSYTHLTLPTIYSV